MIDDYLVIKKEIEGKSLKNVQKDNLSITLRISQNPGQNTVQKIQNTVGFKIDCLDNLYEEYRVYCRNLLSDKKFENKFQKKIEENIKTGTKIFDDINFAIKNIDNYYSKINVTSELSEIFNNNKSSIYFGRVYNNFEKEVIQSESFSYKSSNFLNKNNKSYIKVNRENLLSNDKVKSHLLLNLDEIKDSTGLNYNIKRVNITNIISQQLINLTRSMSTLSVGCFLDVENNIDFSNVLPIKEKICVTSENSDVEFFNYIVSENLNFDHDSFLKNNQAFFVETTEEVNVSDRLKRPFTTGYVQNDFTDMLYSNVFFNKSLQNQDFIFERYNPTSSSPQSVMSSLEEQNNLNQIKNVFFDIFNVNIDLEQNTTYKKYILTFLTESLNQGDVVSSSGNSILNFNTYNTILSDLSFENVNRDYFISNIPTLNHAKVYNMGLLNIHSVYNEEYENVLAIEPSAVGFEEDFFSTLKLKNSQIVDRQFNLDYKNLSLKTDSIVKNIKIKSLQNKDINIEFLKNVVKKINNKKTKNKIISYHIDASPDMSLINEDEVIFNALFGKDNDKIYSNFETDKKNNVNSVISKIANDIDVDTEASIFYENYKDIISNYYKGKYFKSSFCFLKKVIADVFVDIAEESQTTNNNFLKNSLCQFLYFNYILNGDKDKKNTESIAKRFFANTIKNYGNCNNIIKKRKLNTFSFNKNNYELKDYDVYSDEVTEENTIKKLIRNKTQEFKKEYFKTSDDLNNIKKSVFSNDNILNASRHTCKSKVGNIKVNLEASDDFVNSVNNYEGEVNYVPSQFGTAAYDNAELLNLRRNESIVIKDADGNIKFSDTDGVGSSMTLTNLLKNDLTLSISFEKIKNILPFVFIKKKCTNTDGNFLQYKNHVLETNITIPFKHKAKEGKKINPITGKRPRDYIFEKDIVDFDFNVNINSGESKKSIFINDYFDNLCDPTKKYVFSSILKSIHDIILILDESLLDKYFESEDDIIDYVNNNSYVTEMIINILDVYGEVYNNAILSLNEDLTDFVFVSDALYSCENQTHLSKYNSTDITEVNSNILPSNKWQIPSFYNYFYSNSSLAPLSNSYRNNQNSLKNYEKILTADEIFNESIKNSNYNSIIQKRQFESILNSSLDLTISDYEKIFSNFNFLYQNTDFNNSTLQRLSSEERLDNIIHNSSNNIDFKSKYTSNMFLSLNTLLKSDSYQAIIFDLVNMFFSFYDDKILNANKEEIFKELDFLDDVIDKTKIFESVSNDIVLNRLYYLNEVFKKFIKKQKNIIIGTDPSVNPENSLVSPAMELIKKEKKFTLDLNEVSSEIDLYKGEIYCFALRKNINVNIDSLIKVKAEVFEHGNINKMYYPKYFYFSPLILDASYLEYVENIESNPNTNNFIGIFDNFNLDNKIKISDSRKLNFNHLNSVIREYFKVEDTSIVDNIRNSIIDNHLRSFKLSKIVDSIYNVNLNECIKKDILSESFYNMILNIDNSLFYNTFSHTKKSFLNDCIINDGDTLRLDFSNNKYFKTVDFLSNLNYLVSVENQVNLINNIENSLYQNIFWDLDLSNFKFKDFKKTRELSSSLASSRINSSEGELLINQDINDTLESFFIENDLNRDLDVSMKRFLSTKLINYENYSVSITIEVV